MFKHGDVINDDFLTIVYRHGHVSTIRLYVKFSNHISYYSRVIVKNVPISFKHEFAVTL